MARRFDLDVNEAGLALLVSDLSASRDLLSEVNGSWLRVLRLNTDKAWFRVSLDKHQYGRLVARHARSQLLERYQPPAEEPSDDLTK
ncbi:hypothetical protein [Spirillospora sp. NPDC047279]|uniref:hypothetical protein n=1 Tax=Spirillospora sp. NPDC047279 TaxID=3155478 RepID=UPI0033E10596